MAKTKIFRTFTENLPTTFRKTIFQENHFPKVFCWFSNFPKIVRKRSENFTKNNLSRVLLKAFARVLQLSEVFREHWDNFGQRAFSFLFSSWIHRDSLWTGRGEGKEKRKSFLLLIYIKITSGALFTGYHRAGWRYPARWSASQIARKQGRMSSYIIMLLEFKFNGAINRVALTTFKSCLHSGVFIS